MAIGVHGLPTAHAQLHVEMVTEYARVSVTTQLNPEKV